MDMAIVHVDKASDIVMTDNHDMMFPPKHCGWPPYWRHDIYDNGGIQLPNIAPLVSS